MTLPADDVPPALIPLLGELAASLRERLDLARRALDAGDQGAYRAALHAAKGMAMTFGLHALADQALQAEDLADRPEAASAKLERLAGMLDGLGREEKAAGKR